MAHPLLTPDPTVYRAVVGLRTVRHFRPEPLPPDVEGAVLEAGRWTGSSKNRQPWAFLVVRDRDRLARLAACGDFTDPVRRAPLVIVPVRLPGGHDWDLGRASQSIMLAAAALGVGTCPVTLHREDEGREVLGVPADHGCRFVIAAGFPDDDAERAARATARPGGRRALADLVYEEVFGAR